MIKITRLKIALIYLTVVLLICLYIFSFTIFSSEGQKNKFSQTIIFLHEADIPNIDGFIIHTSQSELIISKTDDMWLIADSKNPQNKIPADVQKLKSLFLSLASPETISKAAEKTNLQAFGLDENNNSSLSIFKNGILYHKLDFGQLDFSQTQRYFTDEELNSVFYIDTSFDTYLTTSVQNWSDPYIISKQIKESVFNTGDILSAVSYDYKEKKGTALTSQSENWTSKISKLEELRHGGFAQVDTSAELLQNASNLLTKIQLETGNLCQISIDIFATNTDEEYTVKITFYSELSKKEFSYVAAISLWTYNKIKEIML